jgi:hypothetical protein
VSGRKGRWEEDTKKNGGPSTPLKYVATVYFLIPLAKTFYLSLTHPKIDGGWKDEGFYVLSWYFLPLLQLTDWALVTSKH